MSVESMSCIKSIALRIVYLKGFKFRFWRMQINMRRVKINPDLLFIAEDMTMCIKLRNCDILYQFHSLLFLFVTGSVYFSCSSANIKTHGFTWTASKGLRGLTCKLLWTSSDNKHIRKLDTLIAAERSKILRRHGLTWPHTIHSIKLSSFQ